MDNVLRLLQPFFEITKKVSGEKSILSAVIPDVAALDRYLTKYTTKDSGVHSKGVTTRTQAEIFLS